MMPIPSAGGLDADAKPWAARFPARAIAHIGRTMPVTKALDRLLDDLPRENRNEPVIK
jgi:hypothetical protein